MRDEDTDRMLGVNLRQREYYERASAIGAHEFNNASTNLWRRLKTRALGAFSETDYLESISNLHRQWIGDISDAKVLDLGCGSGNPLSVEIASAAREYVAIDLSEPKLSKLRRKLAAAGVKPVSVAAVDFLSDEFSDDGFDLIYAKSVLHHFGHFDSLIAIVKAKLKRGGRVISYDPVQTWLPVRVLRGCFRPWQTDAEWEFPFDDRAMRTLEGQFAVLDRRGILGRGKWAAVLAVFSPQIGARFAQLWHDHDIRNNTTPEAIRSCLHVTYHLRSD